MDCGFGSSLLLFGTGPGLSLADRTIPTDNGLMCSGRWTRGESQGSVASLMSVSCVATVTNLMGYVEWGLVLSVVCV